MASVSQLSTVFFFFEALAVPAVGDGGAQVWFYGIEVLEGHGGLHRRDGGDCVGGGVEDVTDGGEWNGGGYLFCLDLGALGHVQQVLGAGDAEDFAYGHGLHGVGIEQELGVGGGILGGDGVVHGHDALASVVDAHLDVADAGEAHLHQVGAERVEP